MDAEDTPQQFEGYLRLEQIIGTKKVVVGTAKRPLKRERRIVYPPLIPVSRGTWLNGVRDGRFPKPVHLGPRIVVWRAKDVYALISHQGAA